MGKEKKVGLYEVEWATISIRAIKIVIFVISAAILFTIYWFLIRGRDIAGPDISSAIATGSTARFLDYEGRVEVKPKDEFVWKAATFKMDLHEGDRIRTAPDSTAKVRFDDGTEITVQSDSIVVISAKSNANQKQDAPLVVIEIGESDVNADKSTSPPTLASEKIKEFKVAPGSHGGVAVNSQSGEHAATIDKGYGEVTSQNGKVTQLKDLEQLKIEKNNTEAKIKLPLVPPLLGPQNGQLFEFLTDEGLTVELKWRDVSSAVHYHVQISESSLFGKLSGEDPNTTKSSIQIKIPKTTKKQYFWRVRSIDKAGNKSPWSDPFQFVVQTPIAARQIKGIDKTPPALQVTYLHPFFPFVQVEGKTEPDAILTLNGEIIDVQEDGSFVYNYTLQQTGVNKLTFVAEDPAGNKTTVEKSVTY
jgi:hypothetical protein